MRDQLMTRPQGARRFSLAQSSRAWKVGSNYGRGKFAPVGNDGGLGDQIVGLQVVFDRLRCNELAAGGLDQVLLAVGDVQKAVLVDVADVAGVEPLALKDRAPSLRA